MAHWGADEIAPLAADASFRVRSEVAREMGRLPGLRAALIVRDLLLDPDMQVQTSCLDAIDDWPDEFAVPLLLAAMTDSLQAVRKTAAIRLRKRTGIDQPFPFDAGRAERVDAVASLVREYDLPAGFLDSIRREGLPHRPKINELRVAEIRAALDEIAQNPSQSPAYATALDRLNRQLTADDVAAVEAYLLHSPIPLTSEVYKEVLPRQSPVFGARPAGGARRQRAPPRRRHAVQAGSQSSLSPLAVHLLHERLTNEQDNLVWRYAIQAIFEDATDESAAIACLAANHNWPDIRQLGCQYIGRHGNPHHAGWLLPRLHDPNRAVQLAAIEAAGRCNNPIVLDQIAGTGGAPPIQGLRSLLTDFDRQVQLAAALNMAKFGDAQAVQEMIRLSFDQNPGIRENVVREMGRSGQPQFVDHLIQLGWTESNVKVKRAISPALEELTPAEKRPPELVQQSSDDAKIRIWNAWWQEQNRARAHYPTAHEQANQPAGNAGAVASLSADM